MITQLDISGIHYEISDDLKKYITKKIGKMDRFTPRHARKSMSAEVRLTELKTKTDRNQCEVVLNLPNNQIVAKGATVNMFAAVDIVETKLKRQLHRYKTQKGGDTKDKHGLLRRIFRNQRNN